MRMLLASVFVIGLSAGGVGAADEAYTIKLYKGKAGDKTANERSEGIKVTVLVDTGDMNDKDDSASGSREVYTEEILEKKDGTRATKLLRKYTAAEKTEKGETTKAVYAGKTVLIERKGAEYQFSIDGKALEENDAPELYKSFNKGDDKPDSREFLPKDPVKVGESWKVPAAESAKMFKSLGEDKLKIDAEKSTIEGKLLKVYKKSGAQFGVIELTVTVAVTEIDLDGQFFKTTADSKVVLKGTLDTCIDGTVEFEDAKADTIIDVTAELPDSGSLTIQGTITNTAKVRASRK